MIHCPKCKRYFFTKKCTCRPYYATIINYDDEAIRVYADSEEEAAEKRAEEYDEGEYDLLGGGTLTIKITYPLTDKEKFFEVSGEALPTYHAVELEEVRNEKI